MSEITGIDNEKYKPYEGSGIEIGDIIEKVNGKIVSSTAELTESINNAEESNILITYLRNGEEKETNINRIKVSDETYKIGLWVRDTAARCWYSHFL